MPRLQTEIERLYGTPPGDGSVRGLVLELARPAEWPPMARLWQGVQADLGWPAPAIVVNGVDGYQLWFSLAQALPRAQAQALLAHLRQRYLPEIPSDRLRLLPGPATQMPQQVPHQVAPEVWSAFVSSDLAAVFADTPWLDLPPGEDAQAELLGRLLPTPAADVARVLAVQPPPAPGPASAATATATPTATETRADDQEARQFLLGVMRDPAVDLALRVQAAQALLG
jgi:hypothetical protein